jgi:hypothetical protein
LVVRLDDISLHCSERSLIIQRYLVTIINHEYGTKKGTAVGFNQLISDNEFDALHGFLVRRPELSKQHRVWPITCFPADRDPTALLRAQIIFLG